MPGHHLVVRQPVRQSLRLWQYRGGVLQLFPDARAVSLHHERGVGQPEMKPRVGTKRSAQNVTGGVAAQTDALACRFRGEMPTALGALQCRHARGVLAQTHDEPTLQLFDLRTVRSRNPFAALAGAARRQVVQPGTGGLVPRFHCAQLCLTLDALRRQPVGGVRAPSAQFDFGQGADFLATVGEGQDVAEKCFWVARRWQGCRRHRRLGPGGPPRPAGMCGWTIGHDYLRRLKVLPRDPFGSYRGR